MITPMVKELVKQLFKKPATNKFPAKYLPKSATKFLEKVSKGETKIVPPIKTPPHFRGKLKYEKEKCIGCWLCVKVCPSKAIERREKEKKICIYVARCTFCSQCVDVCPVKCLSMSDEFLLATYDKFSQELVIK